MKERFTCWKLFKDVSFNTNLKPEEAKKRENEALVVYPKRKLPHEIARGAKRLLPHELLRRLRNRRNEGKNLRNNQL